MVSGRVVEVLQSKSAVPGKEKRGRLVVIPKDRVLIHAQATLRYLKLMLRPRTSPDKKFPISRASAQGACKKALNKYATFLML